MSKTKKIPIFIVVFSILLVPFSLCASATTDIDFCFNICEPAVDDFHGYIVVPYTGSTDNIAVNSYAYCYFWVITPTVNNADDFEPPTVRFSNSSSASNVFNISFSTGLQGVSYALSIYRISSESDSVLELVKFDTISYGSAPNTYITTPNSDWAFGSPTVNGALCLDPDYMPTRPIDYSIVWNDDRALYDELTEVNTKLTDLINSLDLTNEQLEETYALLSEYLSKIQTNTNQIKSQLVQLYDDFYAWTFTVDENHYRIIDLLEQLIEGTEDYTESPTLSDEQSELNRVEDELLNNEEASNAQNEIKVEINENAMSYIWGLITDFVSSNPKIFGLFISILSLGIIALILNR